MAGLTLRGARKMRNITQDQMAKHLGVTVPTLRKWENDQDSIPLSVARKACTYLEVQPADVFLTFATKE